MSSSLSTLPRARRRLLGAASGLLTLSTAGGHLVYPALLHLLTQRRPVPPSPPAPAHWPELTVLVPAYREAGVIFDKVVDVQDNGYPGDVTVLVVADDQETAAAARASGAKVLEPGRRLGKAQAINLGMSAALTEVVVLTDANNRIGRGALALLARHFSDPLLGAVAGEKVEADGGGEEVYWRFESWLKKREWMLGTTIGVTGELVGVRRSLWKPIPTDVSTDDLWLALDYNERGHAIAYEPAARSIDPPVDVAAERWERRTRILAASLFVLWRKRALLLPRYGVLALQIVGHRLWRSTVGPLSHVALLGLAVRHHRRSRVAMLFVASHVAGASAVVWRDRVGPLPGPLAAGAQLLYLQIVALGGMVRFARGQRLLQWTKRSR